MTRARRYAVAFTLIEMLAVIAILVLLISIMLPSLLGVKDIGRRTVCMSNQRQLALAWTMYQTNNAGELVFAGTGTNAWTDGGREPEACKRGLLYPYAPSVDVFHCVADLENVIFRTYSMSGFINGNYVDGKYKIKKMHQIEMPSDTILAVEEYDSRGWNKDSWTCHPPYRDEWVDVCAAWHNNGATFSFTDTHAEYWPWADKRTKQLSGHYISTPNNPDLRRIQEHILPVSTPIN